MPKIIKDVSELDAIMLPLIEKKNALTKEMYAKIKAATEAIQAEYEPQIEEVEGEMNSHNPYEIGKLENGYKVKKGYRDFIIDETFTSTDTTRNLDNTVTHSYSFFARGFGLNDQGKPLKTRFTTSIRPNQFLKPTYRPIKQKHIWHITDGTRLVTSDVPVVQGVHATLCFASSQEAQDFIDQVLNK